MSWSVHEFNENHSDSNDDDIDKSGLNECEWDSILSDPEEQYHLPRSSPVISRKRCDAELKTEKQASPSNLCLTTTNYDRFYPNLSTSPLITAKSNIFDPRGLDEFTHTEKPKKTLSASNKDLTSVSHKIKDSSPKDILEQPDFLKSKCCSQRTQILSRSAPASARSRVPLNKGFQPRGKRRACSDIPPTSSQRSSGHARKQGSFIDVHCSEDVNRCSLDQVL